MVKMAPNQYCDEKLVSLLSLVSVRRFLGASDHYLSLNSIIQKCPMAVAAGSPRSKRLLNHLVLTEQFWFLTFRVKYSRHPRKNRAPCEPCTERVKPVLLTGTIVLHLSLGIFPKGINKLGLDSTKEPVPKFLFV